MLLQIDRVHDETETTIDPVRGSLTFYHYKCDGHDDRGWGCGYRTLQTLCSWKINQNHSLNQINGLAHVKQRWCLVNFTISRVEWL
ncbi:unnamed protein product [Adineta ricciae]|uniref:UFSP1/2/DUB catalytic domain-containing protein n=1 Tax=Adineta ricciae TaxID=249248 RepID=A0A814DN46_ADIRI|nr:unnamed protein product [Adineta ricciae]